jgi:hypothetical protein
MAAARGPGGPSPEEVRDWFAYHPATPLTGPVHDAVRTEFGDLAEWLYGELPPSASRTLALRKLQEAMWAANASVAIDLPKENS